MVHRQRFQGKPMTSICSLSLLSREDGKWNIYMESLPNLVIPRKKDKGNFVANTLGQLAEAGEKEIGREYKYGNGEINDKFISKEFNEDLKKNHQRFISRKIKK
ncbi:hypothetical protein C8N37_103400 [Sphingobacterium faecium]|nr:hypothetical protein C8N37_103400 [Sphingobacterium faecium]